MHALHSVRVAEEACRARARVLQEELLRGGSVVRQVASGRDFTISWLLVRLNNNRF